ncbi:LysR family transcriptional regulator [Leptolyngbya sp. NK1-12]|uniref:LysR family transcriptional regulator n=1 Tax=Leptolyngbya sp. NK1-12 TaxID=2547451 RepID=UPI00292E8019|nr:LysR family transcriptional regulator [Leptolyngbya sp. NK1-12]
MIELRHLRYFIAVAEELHFGRAAERLHMAQPPLSQQIKQLEAELGFQLFHRTKRSVQLTEAGQVFLAESRKLLHQLEQAIQTGRQVSRGEKGQLVIGFVSSAAYNVLPVILRRFRSQVPAVRLELHEMPTNEQLDWLRDGKIDIGFLRPPVEDKALQVTTIVREPMVVALPENHPLTDASQITLSQLANEGFILFPRPLSPRAYDQIISLCQQAGFSPNVVQEAMQMQTIVSLVAGGIGVSIVPVSLENMQRTGVVYKPLAEPAPCAEIAVAWRQNDHSPSIQRFLEIVNQAMILR